jgi:NMT1-like family
MPPGLPHRPPLAMRFWLFRRSGKEDGTASSTASLGRASGRTMSIESVENMVKSRVRMFLRHTWLVTILGTIVIGALVWAGFYYAEERDHLRVAASPRDTRFVQVLSDQIAAEHRDLHLQLVPTAGAQGTAEAVSKGQADLAVLPSNLDDSLNWPAVAILRQNVMALIVPAPGAANKPKPEEGAAAAKPAKKESAKSSKSSKTAKDKKGAKAAKSDDSDDSDDSDSSSDSKFGKVTDLTGKRVGIVKGNEATRGLLELVLSHYGVPLVKVTVSEIEPNDVALAVKNNQVDALFVAGPATGEAISSTVAAATQNGVAPNFIEIDQADGIAKRNPAFGSVDIDAGTFGGTPPSPNDSLKSLSFAEYLVARRSLSSSIVGTLAKVIYTSRQSIASALPRDMKIAAPSTDKDADIVTHPGALDYLTDNQKSFFDKYGDDIFYGMLIFPVFGSAIAGVASYLRSDTRTRRLRLLQRVLDMVRKAHTAESLEAIEHLQIEADNLVIAIIHQSEHEEFDETVRMSFAFALDQLRFAIAARRTAILDHSGAVPGEVAPAIAPVSTPAGSKVAAA